MGKTPLLFAAAFFFICTLCFASEAEKISAATILGRWESAEERGVCYITYRSEGIFYGRIEYKTEGEYWFFQGKWRFENGSIVYAYTKSSRDGVELAIEHKDRVLDETSGQLTLLSEKGNRHVFVRSVRQK